MKHLFLIAALVCWIQASGQTETAILKSISSKFEVFYNASKYDSIFAMYSDGMQKFLPLEKTVDFFSGLRSQAGSIRNLDFKLYEEGYASYKASFEKVVFKLAISVNENGKIAGMYVRPFPYESDLPATRNSTKLILPFKDEWTVFWGGDTRALNYHVDYKAQKNAFDMMITNSYGGSFKKNGSANEDYYAFGKQIIAPCDGVIVFVTDGLADNKPGIMDPKNPTGNSVVLKTKNGEFLLFAHFKQNSIVLKGGQKIKQGELLGLCGNSGNSSEPHLHFHIQDAQDMETATGVKCYFEKLVVNGELKTDYSPVKNDKIKPAAN